MDNTTKNKNSKVSVKAELLLKLIAAGIINNLEVSMGEGGIWVSFTVQETKTRLRLYYTKDDNIYNDICSRIKAELRSHIEISVARQRKLQSSYDQI